MSAGVIAASFVESVVGAVPLVGTSMVTVLGRPESGTASRAICLGYNEGGIYGQLASFEGAEANPLSFVPSSISWQNPMIHPDGGIVHLGLYGASGSRKLGGGRYYWQDTETWVREEIPEVSIPNYDSISYLKDMVYLHVLNDNTNAGGLGWQLRSIRDFSLLASGDHMLRDNFDMQVELTSGNAYTFPEITIRNTLYFRGLAQGRSEEWWYGIRFNDVGEIEDTFELAGYSPYASPDTTYRTSSGVMECMRTGNSRLNVRTHQIDPWYILSAIPGHTSYHTFDPRLATVDEYGSLCVITSDYWSSVMNRAPGSGSSQAYPMVPLASQFSNAEDVGLGDTSVMKWASDLYPQASPFEWVQAYGAATLPATGSGGVSTLTLDGTEHQNGPFYKNSTFSHNVVGSRTSVGHDDLVVGVSFDVDDSSVNLLGISVSEDDMATWEIDRYVRAFSSGYQATANYYTHPDPSPGPWTVLDLSAIEFYETDVRHPDSDSDSSAFYVAPNIVAGSGAFYLEGLEADIDWDNGSRYQFEFTLARNDETTGLNSITVQRVESNTQPSYDATMSTDVGQLTSDANLLRRIILEPGVLGYDTASTFGWNALDFILAPGNNEATAQASAPAISQIRWRELPPGSDPGPDPDPVYPPPESIILLPNGLYEDAGSPPFQPTIVGTQPVLADADDATYIESNEDEFPYTIGLESLVGYEVGMSINLHIRLSVTGDGDPVDAQGEVFIATEGGTANSGTEIGGFSDGTALGFGFNIPLADGTIQDLVVPLSMAAWSPNTEADVVAALEAGAFLDFNTIDNFNWDTPPVIKVYRAWIQLD